MNDQIVHTILQTAGTGGVLALVSYILITKTIPKLGEDQKAELKELHATHRADLSDQRDKYHTLLSKQQDSFDAMLARQAKTIEAMEVQIRDHTKAIIGMTAAVVHCQNKMITQQGDQKIELPPAA